MNKYYKNRSVRHLGAGRFLLAAVLALLFASCRQQEPVRLYGEAQGTYYSILYYDAQQRNFQPQIDSLLAAFDLSASLWVDSSLLRRLNANLTDSLDAVLDSLLRYSLYINHYTQGAFDCRVGRLVQTWGFSFKKRCEPDSAMLADLMKASHAAVEISPAGRLVKECPATELDFNAIAQGYASDLVARFLASHNIDNYLVDIGGEVIAHGRKADGSPWRVGIERPAEDSLSAPVVETAIPLTDQSVVTSGSYRKYYEKEGVKYSHTIDPLHRPSRHPHAPQRLGRREGMLVGRRHGYGLHGHGTRQCQTLHRRPSQRPRYRRRVLHLRLLRRHENLRHNRMEQIK